MRRFSLAIFITAAALAAVSSCAKREPEDMSKLEEKAFDAWVAKHVGDKAVKQSNGMYVEFIEDGDQTMDSARDTIVWLRLDYTGRDLFHNVFVTRSEGMALEQATFTPQTHYISDYVFCGSENHSMIAGQYFALKNDLVKTDGTTIKMSEGTVVKLYMPSYLAFGSTGYTDDQGYGGQYSLSGTKPAIEQIEVVEVIKDPVDWEQKAVTRFAFDVWGLAKKDTISSKYFFVDTVRFNQELTLKYGKEMSLPFKKEYALSVDSTAKIWYTAKFLDGFVLETNIDTTYNRFYNRRIDHDYYTDSKKHSVMSYKPESDKNNYILAFYDAIPALRKGQWSRIVFTSNYAYGASGVSAAIQQQQDYYNYMMSYMYSSPYGSGYYGYGSGYYDSYYGSSYYGSSYSSSAETTITTEVQSYTPLVFEIYIEADED